MKIALFVEGRSDKDSLPVLARRACANVEIVSRVLPRGDLLNPKKVSVYIEQDIRKQHRDVRKVLLCVDSECTPETELRRIVQPLEKQIRRLVQKPATSYCLVVHATEAWLVCDGAAVSDYLGVTNVPAARLRKIREACRPKQLLSALFDHYGKEFSNVRDNPKLAQKVDPRVLRMNSSSFARFVAIACDP